MNFGVTFFGFQPHKLHNILSNSVYVSHIDNNLTRLCVVLAIWSLAVCN